MKFILSLLLFFTVLQAEVIFDDREPTIGQEVINYDSSEVDDNEPIPQEELHKNSEQILEDVVVTKHKLQSPNKNYSNEQNIFLNIQTPYKKAILSQRVAITIKATVTKDDLESLKTSFTKDKSYKIFNPEEKWEKLDENTYIVKYYLKFLSLSPRFPTFKIVGKFSDGMKNKESIKMEPIKIVELKSDEFFSQVIAKDLTIVQHTEKKYDDRYSIVLIEMDANMSNLDDFSIKYAKKSGVDEFIDSGEVQKAYTYAIVENGLKKFKFKYFDTDTNHYKMISFDVMLKDQTLSTQTDLNPQKSKYRKYKTIALLSLAFLMILLFLKTHSKILLILIAVVMIYTVYVNIPLKTVKLKKGVGLKILPTQNSTIFYIVPKDLDGVVVYENKKFYKVVLPDNKHIGWVKKDEK